MQTFKEFNESTGTITDDDSGKYLNILGVIKTYNGSSEIDVEDDYIATMVPSMKQVDQIIAAIPYKVDYDVMVYSVNNDFEPEKIKTSDTDDEPEFEISHFDVDESQVQYQLIIYLYNLSDGGIDTLDEIKRIIKVNAKGQRRIKMQCKPGFKFNGKVCVRIAGSELVNKKKAIRKAVRSKRQKGSGFAKRVARLRNKATKKRRNMGL